MKRVFIFIVAAACAAVAIAQTPAKDVARVALRTWWDMRVRFEMSAGEIIGWPSAFRYRVTPAGAVETYGWAEESGVVGGKPLINFQSRDGTAAVLLTYVRAFRALGDPELLAHAREIGDSMIRCQEAWGGGWWQDGSYQDGRWRSVVVWGTMTPEKTQPVHWPDGVQGGWTLDDATTQSCIVAMWELYELTGDDRYAESARRPVRQLEEFWATDPLNRLAGIVPQAMPLAFARSCRTNQNGDARNPDDPEYMRQNTYNDGAGPKTALACWRIREDRAAIAITERAFAVQIANRGLFPGAADWYTNLAVYQRAKENGLVLVNGEAVPTVQTCELGVIDLLCFAATKHPGSLFSARARLHFLEYAARCAALPRRPDGTVWRCYAALPRPPSEWPPVFAANYQAWAGEEHASKAAGGQPWSGGFDPATLANMARHRRGMDAAITERAAKAVDTIFAIGTPPVADSLVKFEANGRIGLFAVNPGYQSTSDFVARVTMLLR